MATKHRVMRPYRALVAAVLLGGVVLAQADGGVNTTALVGTLLRVHFNVMPPQVVRNPNGTYSGFLVDLLGMLAQEAGFQVVDTPLSPEAQAASSNPYDACPLDAAVENVDLCLGDYWEPSYRRCCSAASCSLA